MAARKRLVKKTMPFTGDDLRAAEEWLDSVAAEALMIDQEDLPAMIESLAEAMHNHARDTTE